VSGTASILYAGVYYPAATAALDLAVSPGGDALWEAAVRAWRKEATIDPTPGRLALDRLIRVTERELAGGAP
jgi:hypothetical protein